jgi:glycosyltransferase involved in cell wall biosynthesis
VSGVVFDLVASQSPSYRGRGVDRYSSQFVRAFVAAHPELVSAVVLHPELPVPRGLDDLAPWATMEPCWADGSVLHLSSVFEPEVSVRTFWPREASAAGLRTVVTLYDLIPDVFPGWYLADPGLRRRWRCCREVVRVADAVFCLSESAKEDAVSLLGVPAERVTVIGSGTAPVFHRPESREAAFKVAQSQVEGLEEGFLLYVGAFNPRKNVDSLLKGYALLPKRLVERHQLVIVCEAPPLTRNHYLVMAKDLGVEGRVLIPGFVPEEVLVALNQAADLAVFPSLYEGYGLPVVEAMACGTLSIAGDNSSLREILPREARFAPEDPAAIAEAIAKALTDQFRERLAPVVSKEPPSWADVVERAAKRFIQLLDRAAKARPAWRHRPQLALVGIPPPLTEALGELAGYDSFAPPAANGTGHGTGPPPTEGVLSYPALRKLDPWRGGYDAVVGWVPARIGEPEDNGEEAGGPEARQPRAEAPMASPGHDTRVMEQLAAEWPGRAVAVVERSGALQEKATVSRLEALGVRVVPAGESYKEAARLVVEAAWRARP